MTTTTTPSQIKPPQVSFPKFQSVIRRLKDDLAQGNVPVRLDQSWWESHGYKDHAERSRLRAAAQFMGVTNQDNELTVNGRNLLYPIPDTGLLQELFKQAFQPILEVASHDGISRTELKRTLARKWHMTPAGAERALPFFISGALALELPISSSLVTHAARRYADHAEETADSAGTDVLANGHQNGHQQGSLNSHQEDSVSSPSSIALAPTTGRPGSTTRTVRLRKGGSVTLTVTVDLFDVDDDEREWVLDLVDRIRKHATESEEQHDVTNQK